MVTLLSKYCLNWLMICRHDDRVPLLKRQLQNGVRKILPKTTSGLIGRREVGFRNLKADHFFVSCKTFNIIVESLAADKKIIHTALGRNPNQIEMIKKE